MRRAALIKMNGTMSINVSTSNIAIKQRHKWGFLGKMFTVTVSKLWIRDLSEAQGMEIYNKGSSNPCVYQTLLVD